MNQKIRELKILYPEGFFGQPNGSGVHRSNLTADFIKENLDMTLEFPPYRYSPDLSPIEKIWGWLKNEVNRDMPAIVSSLKTCIKKH